VNFVQAANFSDVNIGSGIPLVPASALVVGDKVTGWFGWDLAGAANLNDVSDTLGNVYELGTRVDDTTNEQAYQQFYGTVSVGGSTTVTANLTVSSTSRRGQLAEYSDVGDFDVQAAQFEATPGTGTDGINSTAAATTTAGGLRWGGTEATSVESGTLSAGTGFTTRDLLVTSLGGIEDALTNAVSEEATFTQSAAIRRCCGMLAFKAVPSNAPTERSRLNDAPMRLGAHSSGFPGDLIGSGWF